MEEIDNNADAAAPYATGATGALRRPAMVWVPPPLLGIALGFAGWGIAYGLSAPALWLMVWQLGLALVVAGITLAVIGVVTFVRAGTQVAPQSLTNRHLVVAGPFRFTRNPMYLGILIALMGVPLTNGMWLQYLAPLAFFLIINTIYIPFEETKMELQFGDEYRAYKRQVRRWV